MNEKIERLRELFARRDEIDAEIADILEGGALPDKKPLPNANKKGRKSKAEAPEKTRRGRRPGVLSPGFRPTPPTKYRCSDCEEEFISEKPKIDVACPACKSVHVKQSV